MSPSLGGRERPNASPGADRKGRRRSCGRLPSGLWAALVGSALLVLTAPAPLRAETSIIAKDGAPMMLVPEGQFLYGLDDSPVALPAFFMDKYEVTTKLYAKFLYASGGKGREHANELTRIADGERPVIGVEWKDAEAYCRYYGKRLPTEEEWEKAARGTDGRQYPWGNEEPTRDLASYDWDGKRHWQGYKTLSTVGSFEAGKSPYGIHDLAGNVAEWTASDFDTESKVVRGGSWLADGGSLRVTSRRGIIPWYRVNAVGFRCAQ